MRVRLTQAMTLAATLAGVAAAATPSAAQTTTGTVELSATTGVFANRQTISRKDGDGQLIAGDVNLTTANAGVEVSYFFTSRVAIGAVIAYQRQSLTGADNRQLFLRSGGYYGPFAQVRLPLSPRSAFVLVGSYGGIRTTLSDDSVVEDAQATQAVGRYWLGGGTVSLLVAEHATLDLGLRYQSSRFTGATPEDGAVTAAGLLVGIGFSVYIK